MKNGLSKWGFSFVALIIMAFSVTCATYVYADGDEQSDNTAVSDEVQLLQMRADLKAEEVNDTISEEMKQAETVKRNRYLEDFHTEPEVNLFSNEELAAFEQQRQEKLKVVQAQFDNEIQDLQNKKAAEGQNQNPQAGMMPKSRPVRGLVAGIVVFQKRGAALVDGRIVRENSTLRDIKVTAITKDYVEFEKQGKTWRQMVGQFPPGEYWAEPVNTTQVQKAEPNQKPAAAPKQSAAPQQAPAKQPTAKVSVVKPVGQKTKVKK